MEESDNDSDDDFDDKEEEEEELTKGLEGNDYDEEST